jgi:hypothetical protein
MTFLPIAERELRVAARKRSTFWLRVVTALVGLIIGGICLMVSALSGAGTVGVGRVLFGILTWLAVIAALAAGLFFTSDSLSEEKREGTLGFLFLTDLKGYDIAAGKLLATSLRCFYGLLALLPILAITLIMGGVTGIAFWKTSLALVDALLVSLTAGLFVSAVGRDSQKVLAGTFFLLLLLIFGGPITDMLLQLRQKSHLGPVFALASPGWVFREAGVWGRTTFWPGLAITICIALVLFGLVCALVPRTWQEKGRRADSSREGISYSWRYGSARRRSRIRLKLMERNPVLWLACRERWQSVSVWLVAIAVVAGFIGLLAYDVPRDAFMVWMWFGWLYTLVLYLWLASQTGRFFVEARRSGLTELLLASPLPEREIVRGQWRGLLRMFGLPVLLLLLIHIAATFLSQGFFARAGGQNAGNLKYMVMSAMAAITTLTTLGNLIALAWFGMWMGMTSKTAHFATLKTFLIVWIIPWMLFSITATVLTAAVLLPWLSKNLKGGGSQFFMWYPLLSAAISGILTLAKNVGLFLWARRQLYFNFREQATRTPGQPRLSSRLPIVPLPPVLPKATPPPLPASPPPVLKD